MDPDPVPVPDLVPDPVPDMVPNPVTDMVLDPAIQPFQMMRVATLI
jgi:hypothetical protein